MPTPFSNRPRRFLFPLFFLLAFALITGVVYWLWNNVLVAVVAVKTVSYGQAAGLLLLSRILFGGFRFGPPANRFQRGGPAQWREKWRTLSDEERAKFRSEWKSRGWGRH